MVPGATWGGNPFGFALKEQAHKTGRRCATDTDSAWVGLRRGVWVVLVLTLAMMAENFSRASTRGAGGAFLPALERTAMSSASSACAAGATALTPGMMCVFVKS